MTIREDMEKVLIKYGKWIGGTGEYFNSGHAVTALLDVFDDVVGESRPKRKDTHSKYGKEWQLYNRAINDWETEIRAKLKEAHNE